jgi:hypothetical protein
MADHGHDSAAGHPAMDYAEHEKTYKLFLVLAKWTTIVSVAILVFLAVTLLELSLPSDLCAGVRLRHPLAVRSERSRTGVIHAHSRARRDTG